MNIFKGLVIPIIALTFSQTSHASFDVFNTIKIVNHFPSPLTFKVLTINDRNIGMIPKSFILNSGDAISGDIAKLGSDGRPVQEVYFKVSEVIDRNSDHGFYNAFLGVSMTGSQLKFNKYDHYPYEYGIQYSWVHDTLTSSVITFCSESEFSRNLHC